MTRRALMEAVRAKGLPVRTHHVDVALRNTIFRTPPAVVGDRLIYGQEHVDDLIAYVQAIQDKRARRAAEREAAR